MRVDCRVFAQDLILHKFLRAEGHYVIIDRHGRDNLILIWRVEHRASTSMSLTIWKARNSTGSIPLKREGVSSYDQLKKSLIKDTLQGKARPAKIVQKQGFIFIWLQLWQKTLQKKLNKSIVFRALE